MSTPYPELAVLLLLLPVYICAEYKLRSPWHKLFLKLACSLLFIAAAVAAMLGGPMLPKGCLGVFLAAFLLSAAGDTLLALPVKQSFLLGLGAFLLAQCAFAVAFSLRWGLSGLDIAAYALLAGIAVTMLKKAPGMRFGPMAVPVIFYALALSAMAAKAVSGIYIRGSVGALLAAAGGLLFYASDVVLSFIVFNRKKPKCLTAVNLALYYVGQGLLALSLYLA